MRLRDRSGKLIARKSGTLVPHPSTVANNYAYPIRQIMSVDGISEVIEQRAPGPLLNVVDDQEHKQNTSRDR